MATVPMQRTLFESIAFSQRRLAETQQQLATGKKAPDFASLGIETMRNLSARTLLARQEAHAAVGARVGTTLALVDTQIGGIEEAMNDLRTKLLEASATGRAEGLQELAEETFQRFRTALNSDEGGTFLFAGSRTDTAPFVPASLAASAGVPTANAFANDNVEASARVAEGYDIAYGTTASALGAGLYDAFRTLAGIGPIPDAPTPAQLAALGQAVGQINDGMKSLRAVRAEVGRRQAQVESMTDRAADRALIMERLVARNEDADMAEVASTLTQQQTTLQASYTVFSRLSNLSLVNFLR
ncbi:flagellar hook-filament junction protein FlgL [Sphingomonas astaxanthinifaciens DSM 22298]|uniref:Flagellar hook-filament junction protein FlgL n=1 Tax=Sphingomonas astaxanthinifaciens DSM 22298 TaxID=1123267 RepID=A0ABQ5Z706_9SPHN|nr:flagellar hook-filament junction protein FlgL [Sphingomonas astaxanthinifaciens DSM 22298]